MKSFPKCKVCNLQFTIKGPSPYLLPCLHSVCETCVTSTAGRVISCSACQRDFEPTKTHPQKDVVRQREILHLTVQHRPSELLCTHEDDGNQAVSWCGECGEFLCEYCQNMHESFQATRKHAIAKIGYITESNTDREEYCKIHKTCPLDYWDKECNILICGRCGRGDHAGHVVDDISMVTNTARGEMELLMKEVMSAMDGQTSAMDGQTASRRASGSSPEITEKIRHTVHVLTDQLEQIGKETIIELEQKKLLLTTNPQPKSASSQTKYLRCQSVSDYINSALLYLSNTELLSLKKMIHETAKACLDSAWDKEEMEKKHVDYAAEVLHRMKLKIASVGNETAVKYARDSTTVDEANVQEGNHVTLNGKNEDSRKMREHRNKVWAAVFCCALFFVAFGAVFQTMNSEIHQLRRELSASRSMNTGLEKKLNSTNKLKDITKQIVNDHQRRRKRAETEALWLKISVMQLKEEMKTEKMKHNKCIGDLENTGVPVCMASDTCEEAVSKETQFHPDDHHRSMYIHLTYDEDKVNLRKTNINEEGYLTNSPSHGNDRGRFQNYEGTCSTDPILKTGTPQFWEVKAIINIDKPLPVNNLILEIGICSEEDRDVDSKLPDHPNTYRLILLYCHEYASICRGVRQGGRWITLLPDTLLNTAGTHATLYFGVLFDGFRSLAFLDLTNNKVLAVIDNVDAAKPLWPMFGVYNREWAKVQLKLITGKGIEMTRQKKEMILNSFS